MLSLFPKEIIKEILNYLPPEESIKFSRLSKYFYNLFSMHSKNKELSQYNKVVRLLLRIKILCGDRNDYDNYLIIMPKKYIEFCIAKNRCGLRYALFQNKNLPLSWLQETYNLNWKDVYNIYHPDIYKIIKNELKSGNMVDTKYFYNPYVKLKICKYFHKFPTKYVENWRYLLRNPNVNDEFIKEKYQIIDNNQLFDVVFVSKNAVTRSYLLELYKNISRNYSYEKKQKLLNSLFLNHRDEKLIEYIISEGVNTTYNKPIREYGSKKYSKEFITKYKSYFTFPSKDDYFIYKELNNLNHNGYYLFKLRHLMPYYNNNTKNYFIHERILEISDDVEFIEEVLKKYYELLPNFWNGKGIMRNTFGFANYID